MTLIDHVITTVYCSRLYSRVNRSFASLCYVQRGEIVFCGIFFLEYCMKFAWGLSEVNFVWKCLHKAMSALCREGGGEGRGGGK